ncbi:MAG: hypothetical protein K9N05_07965 [Candidatus Marinimicrobia bacterium]|nr:hypothetical protein [Candidatus Neomarinimicrobiota bacterium]
MKIRKGIFKIYFISLIVIITISCTQEKPVIGFDDLRVISSMEDDSITVIFNRDRELIAGENILVTLTTPDGKHKFRNKDIKCKADKTGNYFLRFALERRMLWSPRNPNLYTLKIKIDDKENHSSYRGSCRFGIRSLKTQNGKFYLNGLPFYVRAYGGEGGCGCDDLSREAIRKRLIQAKNYGFNTVRHHTHIPKEAYMKIADEVGILVQMEIGGNQIGDDVHTEKFAIWEEKWKDMIKMGRRHPATFIYGCGNEMYRNDPGLIEVLDSLYVSAKALDPGTLVLNRSGSNPFNDAYGKFDLIERPIGEYEHNAEFANEAFEAYLRGDRKGRIDEFPIIAHEYPLVASYPNPDLIPKYDSIPEWIQITFDKAKENGLEHLLPVYVKNTEAIQAQVRKEMLEEARKFPELDGYSMLRFTDCGAYVSGVVDDFADPKNVSAEEFLQTNGETVLLCSWEKRVLSDRDTLKLTLHCSHHGNQSFGSRGGEWEIFGEAEKWINGEIPEFKIQAVDVKDIVNIEIPLNEITDAQKLTLKASAVSGKKKIKNEWDFWVFPEAELIEGMKTYIWDPKERLKALASFIPEAIYEKDIQEFLFTDEALILSDSWDESFYEHLDKGGKIWILSGKTWAWPEEMGIFGLHITRIDPAYQAPPVFPQLDEPLTNWLTICSNHPKRYGNSGTIIFDHPALKNFPHDGYCDMQFWSMIYRAKSLRLKDFPEGTKPMIQPIDNFYRGEYKGYLVEMQVGKGKLLISTLNLIQHLERSVSTRFMVQELLHYMLMSDHIPDLKISSDELRKFIETYAQEVLNDPPRDHSEMAARYETLWERRLSPSEVIVLYPYEAEEAVPEKLDIHYEYAQTQWYYKAGPGEVLTWKFENDIAGDFELYLNIAGVFPDNALKVQIDGREEITITPECSGSWQNFIENKVRIDDLDKGEHRLIIRIDDMITKEKGIAFLVREMQIKEIIK